MKKKSLRLSIFYLLAATCVSEIPECYAMETESASHSLKSSPKHDISELKIVGKQVFGRPTYDCTAKYMLDDDEVRLDFVETFTGLKNIESTEKLDTYLNPIKRLTNFKDVMHKEETKKFLTQFKKTPDLFSFKERLPGKDNLGTDSREREEAKKIIAALQENYEELLEILPEERNSQLDILCKLKDGKYVAVEIQVVKEDYWDQRALAYLGSIYGNQLRKGKEWKKLKKVIGINILGGGAENVKYWPGHSGPVRHYIMQDDQDPTNVIEGIELYQYSLGNSDLESDFFKGDDKKELKDWLHLFKYAQDEEKVPAGVSPKIEKAYDKLRIETMPKETKDLYLKEEGAFKGLTEYGQIIRAEGEKAGIEKGKLEEKEGIAKKMIEKGLDIIMIEQLTGVSKDRLEQISQEMKNKTLTPQD